VNDLVGSIYSYFPKTSSIWIKRPSKTQTLPFPPDPYSNAMQYVFPTPKMLRRIQIHSMPRFQIGCNIHLRDVHSNGLQVSSQCIANTTCLYHGLVTCSSECLWAGTFKGKIPCPIEASTSIQLSICTNSHIQINS
jgi:hypothetical protein